MGVNQDFDITADDRRTVLALLEQHLPTTAAWVYGSRVKWTSQPQSDLDLVVFSSPEQRDRVGTLREAFEESNLPFRVDLFVWADVPQAFREQILAEHVVIAVGRKGIIKGSCQLTGGSTGARQERRLHEVAELVMGQSPPGSTYNDVGNGLPFFQGVKDFNYRYPTPRVFCSAPTRIAQPGDILFSVRAPIGRVNIADRECATGRGLAIIRPRLPSDARYLEFALRSLDSEWDVLESSGSVFGNATKRDLQSLPLPWPYDESERSTIAHILGTLDDKIELNRQMNETMELIARALFKSWFVDFDPVRAKMKGRWRSGKSLPGLPAEHYDLFPDQLVPSELGEIPEGWEVKALGDVIEIYDSRRVPLNRSQRANRQGSYPYYGAAGIMDYVDDYLFDGVYVLIGEDGSVINTDGHPVAQYIWGQFWVNNHAHVLKGTIQFSEEHLYLLLQQLNILPFVTGAVQPKLSQRNLKAVPIVVPGRSVCSTFSGLIGPLFERVRDCADESKPLVTLRDALLSKLVRGEVQVRETDRFPTGEAL